MRYARFLKAAGMRVQLLDAWKGEACDLLIALHAKKSAASALAFARVHPERPLIVVLTGTDLYRDLARSQRAQRALDLASAIVVLQSDALRLLKASWRKKATVAIQSAVAEKAPRRRHTGLRAVVLGHLRTEKDPLRAGYALQYIPRDLRITVIQAGAALSDRFAVSARRIEERDRRYQYVGEVSHARAATLLSQSDVLVISSRMEGGANVVCEAIANGVPVIASRISGNIGLLGPDYPAYFTVANAHELACLLERCLQSEFLRDLRRRVQALQPLVRPEREQRIIQALVKRLLRY